MSPNLALRRIASWAVVAQLACADTYFVAPDGDDANPGTREQPFASVQRAQRAASPGSTVFIRGGLYRMRADQIAESNRLSAFAISLGTSGLPGKPIRYWASEGERPVFDFAAVRPAGLRVSAFHAGASWLHIRGLEVVGVQVTATNHTQSICFENAGSDNVFERLSLHDGMAIGIYGVRGSNNLFLNCDAFRNRDSVSEDGRGGNVDGFGYHPGRGCTNNVFRGCRAWFNSDDGFDCINSQERVAFENCWAFFNGFSPDFKSLADGNGFKAGGYGSTAAERLPRAIPRHVVQSCLAYRNKANGFYGNHHPGGCDWLGNRAWGNRADFNLQGRLADNRTEEPGRGHVLRDNVAGSEPKNMDAAACTLSGNRFGATAGRLPRETARRIEGVLTAPRDASGALPLLDPSWLSPE